MDRVLLGKNANDDFGLWVSAPGVNVVAISGDSYYVYKEDFSTTLEDEYTGEVHDLGTTANWTVSGGNIEININGNLEFEETADNPYIVSPQWNVPNVYEYDGYEILQEDGVTRHNYPNDKGSVGKNNEITTKQYSTENSLHKKGTLWAANNKVIEIQVRNIAWPDNAPTPSNDGVWPDSDVAQDLSLSFVYDQFQEVTIAPYPLHFPGCGVEPDPGETPGDPDYGKFGNGLPSRRGGTAYGANYTDNPNDGLFNDWDNPGTGWKWVGFFTNDWLKVDGVDSHRLQPWLEYDEIAVTDIFIYIDSPYRYDGPFFTPDWQTGDICNIYVSKLDLVVQAKISSILGSRLGFHLYGVGGNPFPVVLGPYAIFPYNSYFSPGDRIINLNRIATESSPTPPPMEFVKGDGSKTRKDNPQSGGTDQVSPAERVHVDEYTKIQANTHFRGTVNFNDDYKITYGTLASIPKATSDGPGAWTTVNFNFAYPGNYEYTSPLLFNDGKVTGSRLFVGKDTYSAWSNPATKIKGIKLQFNHNRGAMDGNNPRWEIKQIISRDATADEYLSSGTPDDLVDQGIPINRNSWKNLVFSSSPVGGIPFEHYGLIHQTGVVKLGTADDTLNAEGGGQISANPLPSAGVVDISPPLDYIPFIMFQRFDGTDENANPRTTYPDHQLEVSYSGSMGDNDLGIMEYKSSHTDPTLPSGFGAKSYSYALQRIKSREPSLVPTNTVGKSMSDIGNFEYQKGIRDWRDDETGNPPDDDGTQAELMGRTPGSDYWTGTKDFASLNQDEKNQAAATMSWDLTGEHGSTTAGGYNLPSHVGDTSTWSGHNPIPDSTWPEAKAHPYMYGPGNSTLNHNKEPSNSPHYFGYWGDFQYTIKEGSQEDPLGNPALPAINVSPGNVFKFMVMETLKLRTFAYLRAGKNRFEITARNALGTQGQEGESHPSYTRVTKNRHDKNAELAFGYHSGARPATLNYMWDQADPWTKGVLPPSLYTAEQVADWGGWEDYFQWGRKIYDGEQYPDGSFASNDSTNFKHEYLPGIHAGGTSATYRQGGQAGWPGVKDRDYGLGGWPSETYNAALPWPRTFDLGATGPLGYSLGQNRPPWDWGGSGAWATPMITDVNNESLYWRDPELGSIKSGWQPYTSSMTRTTQHNSINSSQDAYISFGDDANELAWVEYRVASSSNVAWGNGYGSHALYWPPGGMTSASFDAFSGSAGVPLTGYASQIGLGPGWGVRYLLNKESSYTKFLAGAMTDPASGDSNVEAKSVFQADALKFIYPNAGSVHVEPNPNNQYYYNSAGDLIDSGPDTPNPADVGNPETYLDNLEFDMQDETIYNFNFKWRAGNEKLGFPSLSEVSGVSDESKWFRYLPPNVVDANQRVRATKLGLWKLIHGYRWIDGALLAPHEQPGENYSNYKDIFEVDPWMKHIRATEGILHPRGTSQYANNSLGEAKQPAGVTGDATYYNAGRQVFGTNAATEHLHDPAVENMTYDIVNNNDSTSRVMYRYYVLRIPANLGAEDAISAFFDE